MKAIMITGVTFTKRREIRVIGGRFDNDNKAWIVPASESDKAEELCKANNFHACQVEVADNFFEPWTEDQLREYRKEKATRRSDTLEERASRREKEAEELRKKYKHYTDDYSFMTQPILVGHHSEKRHRKLIDRIQGAWRRASELEAEARELRKTAENVVYYKTRVKGDTERERQEKRDKFDKQIGDEVDTIIWGRGTIIKINKKTARVKTERGEHNVDKSWLK